MTCFIPQIGAGARVDDGNVEYKCLVFESRVVVEEYPRLRCDVRTQRVQSAVSSAGSLSVAMYLQQQTGLYSRERIKLLPGEHPIVGERAPSRICARYGVEAGGSLPATVHDTCHQQVSPRHVTPGSCLRFPSTGGPTSCLLARPPGIPQMP